MLVILYVYLQVLNKGSHNKSGNEIKTECKEKLAHSKSQDRIKDRMTQTVVLYSSVFIRKLSLIQLPGFAFRESGEDTTAGVYRSNPP